MSLLAEVMEAIRYTEAQNQMLLSRKVPLERLAKAWGKSVRRLERQRKLLIELESIENEKRKAHVGLPRPSIHLRHMPPASQPQGALQVQQDQAGATRPGPHQ